MYKRQGKSSSGKNDGAGKNGHQNVKCNFCCKRNHSSDKCFIFNDPQKRYNRCCELNLCTLCLKPNHFSVNCHNKDNSAFMCKICNRRHHTLLCFQNDKKPKIPSKGTDSSNPPKGNESKSKSDNPSKSETSKPSSSNENSGDVIVKMVNEALNNHINSSDKYVLLETAQTLAFSFDRSASCYVNILFDSAAQHSILSQRIADMLNLDVIGKKSLKLKVFGFEIPRQEYDIVKLTLKCEDDCYFDIHPVIIPFSATMKNQSCFDLSKYEQFKGLNLANKSSNSHFDVELLIGQDYYNRIFMYKNVIKICLLYTSPSPRD